MCTVQAQETFKKANDTHKFRDMVHETYLEATMDELIHAFLWDSDKKIDFPASFEGFCQYMGNPGDETIKFQWEQLEYLTCIRIFHAGSFDAL